MTKDYTKLADRKTVERTMAAMRPRGVTAEFVETGKEALAIIESLIPEGVSVMSGSSMTLEAIGFQALIAKSDWVDLKAKYQAEDDKTARMKLRREASLADYWLGSVHAVAETGETVTASQSGSQLPAYSYNARNLIWVIGTNKIETDLDAALKRVREYSVKRHIERFPDAEIFSGKQLIFQQEESPDRTIHAIFINEAPGY
jgi:YkgG family uncharacterized protein